MFACWPLSRVRLLFHILNRDKVEFNGQTGQDLKIKVLVMGYAMTGRSVEYP